MLEDRYSDWRGGCWRIDTGIGEGGCWRKQILGLERWMLEETDTRIGEGGCWKQINSKPTKLGIIPRHCKISLKNQIGHRIRRCTVSKCAQIRYTAEYQLVVFLKAGVDGQAPG